MSADPNVALGGNVKSVKVNGVIDKAVWLDSGKRIKIKKGDTFAAEPFAYGRSYSVRVAKFTLK